jgi:hypothetical protein
MAFFVRAVRSIFLSRLTARAAGRASAARKSAKKLLGMCSQRFRAGLTCFRPYGLDVARFVIVEFER